MSLRDPHGNELRIITKKETSFETTEAWNMEIVLLFVFCSCSIQQKKKELTKNLALTNQFVKQMRKKNHLKKTTESTIAK